MCTFGTSVSHGDSGEMTRSVMGMLRSGDGAKIKLSALKIVQEDPEISSVVQSMMPVTAEFWVQPL